ncbi:molybdopterin molybdotransferase MoeA [Curtobacterium sp. MCSS17_015]|uniref:molybdopterin molybdotransferase MoeA n=1 Tax=Curtobacterium sp. MCSS17_015 TaxID=2175666 RepID=UPI000DAA9F1E|nr:molybdopterin molybdotransferase MoeA [Curtobacterium sp. MCSS17_015]WIB27886.1 molybdopterin molybdotransferase MoeA [Curtobacterium sp. MCSS17_015]
MTVDLDEALRLVRTAGAAMALPVETVELGDADGRVLAADVVARTRLPVTDTSAMDGWAVAGRGPWHIDGFVRMGEPPGELSAGEARVVTTGGAVPTGTTAVLRSERGRARDGVLTDEPATVLVPGADVRRAGETVRVGAVVASKGARVTPAVVAASAATGTDAFEVVARPRVAVVLVGDEFVLRGVPAPGQVRDALGIALPDLLRNGGAVVVTVEHVADDPDALRRAIDRGGVDVVFTAAATGHGACDHLLGALEAASAHVVFRGVAMRPGHPTLLARRPDGVPVLGLPGNPFAAIVALTVLGLPLLAEALGTPAPRRRRRVAAEALDPGVGGVRVIPVSEEDDGVRAIRQGPSVVSGAVHADHLAFVPASGVAADGPLDVVDLPWRR